MKSSLIVYAALFYFGAIWGSFFYTLALRLTQETVAFSLLFDRSKCPSCGNPIRWIFLIPLFGYVFTKRRCEYCGTAIPSIYPLMEILYGALAVLVAHRFGVSFIACNYYIIIGIAVCVAIVDYRTMKIPSALVYPLFIVSAYPAFNSFIHFSALEALGGMLLLGLFFFLMLLLFPGSFGGGDITFAAALGMASGLQLSVVLLETALISGAVVGILYGIISKKGIRIKIPFAPFLALGLLVALMAGRELIDLYYRLVL
jgi:leader peptidase (prepilin peptidase)/N-methyltransferase